MNINGKEKFEDPLEKVWDSLHDPEILKNIIPGCEELNYQGDGEYEVIMKLGVAAVKGEYTGKVKLDDIEKPYHYILTAQGSGSPGHVDVEMDCKLNELEDEGCELVWDCQADVGGKIAGVGSRVLGGIAKYMAGKFFKDMKSQMKAKA
ncbi:carbon monoxide dehydrogenase subunit G [Salicibibacter cibarius]|uniref:Carbon monoxide dehydrogenase subunit G n=1 Tax=Salicibibacter cibarius TaxID=2743000 RepID=A0A7T7CAC5_9BACI|nr:carbon monoxide dehydrogenase subunit G [Salicibibacter cibarius]QQK74718.1 carbon monoxide dehydrogenase subunit G [Salicibibacter cibarius]